MMASTTSLLTITDKSSKAESLWHWTRPTHQFTDDGLHILSDKSSRVQRLRVYSTEWDPFTRLSMMVFTSSLLTITDKSSKTQEFTALNETHWLLYWWWPPCPRCSPSQTRVHEFKDWEFTALNETHSPVYWWQPPHPICWPSQTSVQEFKDGEFTALNETHSPVYWWWPPCPLRWPSQTRVQRLRVYGTEWDPLTGLLMIASTPSLFTITDKSSRVQRLRVYSIEWDPLTGLLMMASTSSLLTITDKSSGNPGAFSSSYSTDRSASLNDTKQHLLFMKMNTHLAFGFVCISAHKAQPRGCHVQNENKHV